MKLASIRIASVFVCTGLVALGIAACGVKLDGLEICKVRSALSGAACVSKAGTRLVSYADMDGMTCTNAVGKKALLKQAGMTEREAIKAMGLKE